MSLRQFIDNIAFLATYQEGIAMAAIGGSRDTRVVDALSMGDVRFAV